MKYVIFAVDEVKPSKKYQGDPHAPAWPFRIIVAGASNSGKTNMILNLLVMNKFYYMFRKKKSSKIGERNVKCDDVILCGHHLNEPKYGIVRNFYKYLAQDKSKPYYEDITFSTLTPDKIPDPKKFNVKRSKLTIFEDVCSNPPAIQKKIIPYFSRGHHENISSIYVSKISQDSYGYSWKCNAYCTLQWWRFNPKTCWHYKSLYRCWSAQSFKGHRWLFETKGICGHRYK